MVSRSACPRSQPSDCLEVRAWPELEEVRLGSSFGLVELCIGMPCNTYSQARRLSGTTGFPLLQRKVHRRLCGVPRSLTVQTGFPKKLPFCSKSPELEQHDSL